jgi:hypothetical protein
MDVTTLTPQQLRAAADLQENIDGLQNELNHLLGGAGPAFVPTESPAVPGAPEKPSNGRRKKRKTTAAWKRSLALAREARLEKLALKAAAEPEQPVEKPKKDRNISEAGRKAMSLAGKRRWAKARAAKNAKG